MIKSILIIILLLCLSVMATTHHVSKIGNDGNGGSNWANAWETLDKVDTASAISAGDTIFFATGSYRGSFNPVGGTFGNHTIYACSSFALTNIAGDQHYVKLYNSINFSDSTWVPYAPKDSVYVGHFASLTATGGLVCQGTTEATCDSMLWQRPYLNDTTIFIADNDPPGPGPEDSTSYDGVDAEGEFFIDSNDSVFVYMWDLGSDCDPNSYHIEMAIHPSTGTNPIINLSTGYDGSYVTLYGLQFKYATRHLIVFNSATNADSFFIEHCKLSHVATNAYSGAENPGCIYIANPGATEAHYADYMRVRACSIGYAIDYVQTTHGCGIQWYSGSYSTIDSNTFYGRFTSAAIESKCTKHNAYPSSGNAIKYNIFDPTSSPSGVYWLGGTVEHDSIYGNIFKGGLDCGVKYDCWDGYPDNNQSAVGFYVFNNTFYKVRGIYDSSPAISCAANMWGIESTQVKYNVFYVDSASINTGSWDYRCVHGMTRQWWVDGDFNYNYNLYAVDEQVYFCGYGVGYRELDSTYWRNTLGYDSLSTWTNLAGIGFADTTTEDLSRPNASNEMNVTYGGRTWTIYGALQPDTSISQSITCIDTTTITLQIVDDFALSNTIIDSVIFECSDDSWSTVESADTIGSPTDPDTSTLSGLTQNTEYKIRCRAWDSSAGVTDTSSESTITTDAVVISGKFIKGWIK